MTNHLEQKDQKIWLCILYEVLDKKPVANAYRSFCERIGTLVMNYRDFNSYYHRMSHGTYSLDYGKIHETELKMQQCLFYEISIGMPVAEAYKHFCRNMGYDAMEYQDFKFFFHQFSQGDIYGNYSLDSLRKDSKFLTIFILYEVLHVRNVEVAYKNVCKVFGDNAISYIDFDYWYYRFYHANRDLDDDKERNPKSFLFSDLPAEAIEKVMKKLELKEQLTLRKVSHGFRFLVDEQKLDYKTISIKCKSDCVYVEFNGQMVAYLDHTAKSVLLSCTKHIIRCEKDEDLVKRAFNDIAIAIKNPKVKLESFHFNYESYRAREDAKKNALKIFEYMISLLKSLNHIISVKSIFMTATNQDKMQEMLSYLKPGYLERINIPFVPETVHSMKHIRPKFVNIDKIITLDQWKLAKHVEINTSVSAPIEAFFHFKSFELRLDSNITEMLIHLRDTLPKLTEFSHCSLRFKKDPNFKNYERMPGLKVPHNAQHDSVLHYPIPGTTRHLEFEFDQLCISIRKLHF